MEERKQNGCRLLLATFNQNKYGKSLLMTSTYFPFSDYDDIVFTPDGTLEKLTVTVMLFFTPSIFLFPFKL